MHTDSVNAVSFSHDGALLASASDDASVCISRVENGESVAVLKRFRDWVNDVAFNPLDMRLAAVAQNGELQVWQLEDTQHRISPQQLFSRSARRGEALSSVVWNTDGSQLATGGTDRSITIWDAEFGQPRRQLVGHRDEVLTVQWHSKSLLVSASADGSVMRWDTSRAPDGGRVSLHSSPVRYVTWNPNNQFVAWRDVEGVTTIWNRKTRRPVCRFAESVVGATAVAWHPRGDRIALAREESVLVFGIPQEDQQHRFDTGSVVWTTRWSPDGRYIAAGGSGSQIQLWDVTTGQSAGTLDGHSRSVRTFCWTSNHRMCSADQSATIRLWNVEDKTVEASLKLTTTLVTSLASSRDGQRLSVTTQEGSIQVVNLASMRVQRSFDGHQGPAWASIWISGDQRLASAGQDGTLRVWDAGTGEEALRVQAHSSAVWSLACSHDGLVLVSAGADGEVRFWDASSAY